MAQLGITQKALTLSIAVGGSHAVLEMLAQILPVTYPLLIAERGFTYSQIGTLALVATLFTTVTQPLFGWLTDRFDAKQIVPLSLVWIAVAMALVGWIESFYGMLACVGLAMLGSAAFHPSGAALVSRFGRKETAMSYFATGGAVGAALSPLLIAALLTRFGLRGTLGILPLGVVLAAVIAFALREMPAWRRPKPNAAQKTQGSKLAVALIVIMTGARAWVEGGLASYLPEWQVQQGATLASAGGIFSMFAISFGVGGFISGFLSERFGKWQVVVVSIILMMPSYWLFLNLPAAIAPAALVVLGISAGVSNPLAILMAQESWPQGVGVASSLAIGIGYLPAGLGAWTVGQLADRYSLDFALSTLTFVPLIALAAIIAYRFVALKEQELV